jgi:site-specific DNA-cytosine methylase
MPNRRERFYLVAALGDRLSPPNKDSVFERVRLADMLDRDVDERLWVDPGVVRKYRHALHVVDPRTACEPTRCFTSAYGRSHVRSGSYLMTEQGVRRFSPTEILRMLRFPDSFCLPADLELRRAWSLVGNSLSVPAVRYVLSTIPELRRL